MTVTVYIAKFSASGGRNLSGTVSWDKHTPRRLDAQLCPFIGPSEVDYPVWTRHAPYGREGLVRLIGALKKKTLAMGLTLVSEEETDFAVRGAGIEGN